jgi:hypothetical protein
VRASSRWPRDSTGRAEDNVLRARSLYAAGAPGCSTCSMRARTLDEARGAPG